MEYRVARTDMKTRQLSYFLLACQHRNHADAAAKIGVSASTLSENLSLLEEELALTLFQRGPLGHYPTVAARWLYQNVEPMLQLLEAAEVSLPRQSVSQPERLLITSPLQFMVGRISRASSLAVRELRERFPNVFATARFAMREMDTRAGEQSACNWASHPDDAEGRVVLDYALDDAANNGAVIFQDDWILVSNVERHTESKQIIEFEKLRQLPLLIPPLAPAQVKRARAYCARYELPDPTIVEEDEGTFPRLSRGADPFFMMAPRSLVEGGLLRLHLHQAGLPAKLTSAVVARIVADRPAARTYITLLRRIIKNSDPVVVYEPKITMRQMRYFLAMRDQLNVTAAAQRLNVAQPALSNQLRKLEAVFGRQLFRRHSTGLEPTPDTHRLASFFEPAVRQWDQTASRARHLAAERRTRLSIGIIPLVNHSGPMIEALAAAFEEWTRSHPGLKVQVMEAPTQVLHRCVQAGTISFALVEAHIAHSSRLDLKRQDALGVVSNPKFALLPPGQVPLARVADLRLALPSEIFGLRQLLNRAADNIGVRLVPDIEVNSLTMLLALVQRMPLATIMPQISVQSNVAAGTLQFNKISDPEIRRRLSVIFSTARSLTAIERDLIGILRRHLASVGLSPTSPADSGENADRQSRTKVH